MNALKHGQIVVGHTLGSVLNLNFKHLSELSIFFRPLKKVCNFVDYHMRLLINLIYYFSNELFQNNKKEIKQGLVQEIVKVSGLK